MQYHYKIVNKTTQQVVFETPNSQVFVPFSCKRYAISHAIVYMRQNDLKEDEHEIKTKPISYAHCDLDPCYEGASNKYKFR